MASIFIKYILLFWVSIVFISLLAKIVFYIFCVHLPSRFCRFFFEMFVGLLVVIFIYSITITGFHTLFIGLLIPLTYCVSLWLKDNNQTAQSYLTPDFKLIGKDSFYLVLVATPLFLFWFQALYNSNGNNLLIPYNDHFYYANLSDSFNQYGKENRFGLLNEISPELFTGSTPYHYGEIWLNAFFSKLFHIPGILSLLFISFPVLNTMVVVGFLALWETQGNLNWIKAVLSYTFLFITGSSLDIYNAGIHAARFWYINNPPISVFGVKLSVIYIVLVGGMIAFLKGKEMWSLLIFSLLSFLYVTLLPGVLAACSIAVLSLYFLKRIERRQLVYYFAYLFITGIFIATFYKINHNAFLTDGLDKINPLLSLLFANPNDSNLYKSVIALHGRYIRNLLLFYILYLPFVLLFLYLLKSRGIRFNPIITLLLSVFVFVSLLISPLLEPMPDAFQLFSNSLPALVILIILTIIFSFKHLYNPNRTAGIILFFRGVLALSFLAVVWHNTDPYLSYIGASAKYSDVYIDRCLNALSEQKQTKIVGVIYNQKQLADSAWGILSYIGNDPVFFVRNNAAPLHYVPLNINEYCLYNNPPPLQAYYLKQQPLFVVENYDSTYIKNAASVDLPLYFLKKYQINCVFANKGAFPSDRLYREITDSIVDNLSGEKLYLFSKVQS